MTKRKKTQNLGSLTVSRTESPNHTVTEYKGWDVENGCHSVNADVIRMHLDHMLRMGMFRKEIVGIRVTFLGEDE